MLLEVERRKAGGGLLVQQHHHNGDVVGTAALHGHVVQDLGDILVILLLLDGQQPAVHLDGGLLFADYIPEAVGGQHQEVVSGAEREVCERRLRNHQLGGRGIAHRTTDGEGAVDAPRAIHLEHHAAGRLHAFLLRLVRRRMDAHHLVHLPAAAEEAARVAHVGQVEFAPAQQRHQTGAAALELMSVLPCAHHSIHLHHVPPQQLQHLVGGGRTCGESLTHSRIAEQHVMQMRLQVGAGLAASVTVVHAHVERAAVLRQRRVDRSRIVGHRQPIFHVLASVLLDQHVQSWHRQTPGLTSYRVVRCRGCFCRSRRSGRSSRRSGRSGSRRSGSRRRSGRSRRGCLRY
mmetsp:Transcript_14229/g.42888  ORF Transcript_14229/g.42888 Transcript_14229/m.42888 type:complete len:346 (+) Transcript_14229:270-1307(+)